jgi:hypothetical protein
MVASVKAYEKIIKITQVWKVETWFEQAGRSEFPK